MLAMCGAQLKVTLTFDSAAPREVFVAGEAPKSPPTSTVKAEGKSLEYNIPAFGGSDRIYVWDHSTNNLASKAIKDIQNGAWTLAAADFSIIGKVTVHVEYKGLPVQAAKVTLTGKGKTEERLLDPAAKGDVEFFGYLAGDLKVKVVYNTLDKKEGSQELTFSESPKRDKPEPLLTVAVSDPVATVAESPATPATSGAAPGTPGGGQPPAKPAEQPTEGTSVGKLVLMFLALAACVGLAFWFYYMATKKPKEFESTLQKLGVQIPTQQDPNAGAPIPVTPLAPAPPPPKIMLDDSDPVPLTGVTPVIASPTAAAGDPTLVSESGQRIALGEGESLIGREDGLVVSLAGETTVSRRHASVNRSGKSAVLKDLGSTNGTFVNGTRLQGETALKPGDQIMFGSVRFRYEG